MAAGSKSDLQKYDTKFTCRATYFDGSSEPIFEDVSLTNTNDRASFTITIPDGSPAITCTFVNKPKAAGIKVDKYWVINGGTPVPIAKLPRGLRLHRQSPSMVTRSPNLNGVQPNPVNTGRRLSSTKL